MVEVRETIEIDAPPERVWDVLLDFESYPQWNPMFPKLKGSRAVGSRLRGKLKVGGLTIPLQAKIVACDPNRELRWIGKGPGLTGEHAQLVESLDNGTRTRFVQHEVFTGVLTKLLGSVIKNKASAGYVGLNLAAKARAEQK